MSKSLSPEMLRYYRTHPVEFVEDVVRAEPDEKQCEIMRSVAVNKMTSVRSGHGIGKSAVCSWLVIWYLVTRPFCKIACTAPAHHTLSDVLWAEIAKWIRNSSYLARVLVWTAEKVYMRGYQKEWFAVARTATNPEALQGFHADHLLYIIDEASGVPDKVFEPVLGSLSTEDSRLLMCANPTQLSGFFYESHTKRRSRYNCIRADGRECARVDREFIESIIDQFGEDSNVFRVRVAGEFPTATDDTFIPLSLVEACVRKELQDPPKDVSGLMLDIAADIARFGDDETVIGVKAGPYAFFPQKYRGRDTMETAQRVAMVAEEWQRRTGADIVPVKIDDVGVGGGVTDRLRQLQREDPGRWAWMDVQPVNVGRRIRHAMWANLTTAMMADVRDQMKQGLLFIPPDDELISQLSVRVYSITADSRVAVEKKEEYKKRIGRSPDEADCLMMLCARYDRERARRRKEGA